MPKIKFCGFLLQEDLLQAEAMGMDFVGFNFVPTSKRLINSEKAKVLIATLKRAIPVGIFLESQGEEILRIARETGITWLQIYRDSCEQYDIPDHFVMIHAFRSIPSADALRALIGSKDYALLDGPKNGVAADIDRIAALPQDLRDRLFIAGGLTSLNVGSIVKRIRPFAVDTASGIEHAPGQKDSLKMRAFVDAVRSASNV